MLSSLKARLKTIRISKIEIALISLLLLCGIPMIVLIPPGAGYDEEDHLVRVWELSAFSFLPGRLSAQELKYPITFRDFAFRQQGTSGVLGPDFWLRYGRASLYEDGFVHREINTKSVYSPVLLLPQAIALRLFGRGLDLPVLPAFYLSRFANLLSYLLLSWLAIRTMPFGKWILLVLALSPMALFQAATLSPDAISNGIAFLFLAGCLNIKESEVIGWKELGGLVLLLALLFLGKLNLIPLAVLPFLLLPPGRFKERRMYAALLGSAILLFLLEMVGWYVLASARSGSESLMANHADPVAQFRFMIAHPLAFPRNLITDFLTNGWGYFQGWINGYGSYYWTPPLIVALLFLLALGSVLLMNSTRARLDRRSRIAYLVVFVLGYLATAGAEYTTFTTVGLDRILGMQGRYFIPLAVLPILVLAGAAWPAKVSISSPRWILVLLGSALVLNLLGLYLAFHVPCGSTFYQTALCYRPLFKDLPNGVHASPHVTGEVSLAQEFQVQCAGLTEVRVIALPSRPGDPGRTRFVLREAGRDQPLLDMSVPNAQVTAEDWLSLDFASDPHSAGKTYVLEISGTDPAAQGIQFYFVPRPGFLPGELSENGVVTQEDLILQYGCATGLRGLWSAGRR